MRNKVISLLISTLLLTSFEGFCSNLSSDQLEAETRDPIAAESYAYVTTKLVISAALNSSGFFMSVFFLKDHGLPSSRHDFTKNSALLWKVADIMGHMTQVGCVLPQFSSVCQYQASKGGLLAFNLHALYGEGSAFYINYLKHGWQHAYNAFAFFDIVTHGYNLIDLYYPGLATSVKNDDNPSN